jgi:hypothetical protein
VLTAVPRLAEYSTFGILCSLAILKLTGANLRAEKVSSIHLLPKHYCHMLNRGSQRRVG